MLIDTTLLADNRELIEGLLSGSLQRFGGVVREAGSGRIVRHLLESPGATESLMRAPLPALLKGVSSPLGLLDVAGHANTAMQLQKVNRTLSSVMQLSQVAAAASVLNLGVSVAGFAYMGYKLHQIQKSLDSMQQSLTAGFDRVENRLEKMSGQLAYLMLLVEDNTRAQKKLGDDLAELHRATLVRELADLYSAVLNRSRFSETPTRETIQVASRVRVVMADQAVRPAPEMEPRVLLVVDVATQGWAAATAAEANVLLEIGRAKEARDLLASESARFTEHSRRWAAALLADERPQLATVYRFASPRLAMHITPERVDRITLISPGEDGLSAEAARRKRKDAELELEMAHSAERGLTWDHRQVAIAEYLDGLSELSARLESLGSFAELCEQTGMKSIDLLPGLDTPPGIYALPASSENAKKQ